MPIGTPNTRWRAHDVLDVYRNIIGAPVGAGDECLCNAVELGSSAGDEFGRGDTLRMRMGLSSHEEIIGAERFTDWRNLRREVSGTFAILRAFFKTDELATPEGRELHSAEIKKEIDVLATQRIQLNELCKDAGLQSVRYYMSKIGPLVYAPRDSWYQGILTSKGVQNYRRSLRGLDGPLGFLEGISGGADFLDVTLDMNVIPDVAGVYALSARHMFEELVDLARSEGRCVGPIGVRVRHDRFCNALNIETPKDDRLFKILRMGFGSERALRESHDGWWLEGNRIVVPLNPFHCFSMFESLQREVWRRTLKVVGHFAGGDCGDWEDDFRWLGNALASDGLLHRFGSSTYNMGTHEGYMVNRLLAGLKNFLCPIYNAYIEYQKDPSREGEGVRSAAAEVVSHGFPGRMGLLRLVGNVLGGQKDKIFRNLKVVVEEGGDVRVSSDKQYAAKRFFDGLFVVAGQFEAANGPIKLSLSYDNRRERLVIDNDEGKIANFFSEKAVLLPKLAHEILGLARYVSMDGEGLHFDQSGRRMWVAIQPTEENDCIFAGRPLFLDPIPGALTDGLRDNMLTPGLVTFYPALNPVDTEGLR